MAVVDGRAAGAPGSPVFSLDAALTKPFEFTVVKRSFPEFLESYLDLAQSEDAPLPPWVVFTQLPALQQKSEMQRAKQQGADPDGAQPSVKRRPRVVFDDEAQGAGGRAHSTATAGAAAAAAEGNSAHRQAVMKKLKTVADALHLQLNKDVCDATTVRDYFAIKSLVEFLPSHSLIANPAQGLLTSAPFLTKAKEIVEHLAQVHSTQTASHSARFKRLALRRAGGTGGAEGAVIGHHYGARHAYQLFLRTLVESTDRDNAASGGGGAAAGGARRASMRSSHNVISAMATRAVQDVLPPPLAPLTRDDVLALVESRSGLPHRRITALHLQSRGFQRDSRYFGKIAPDNASEANSTGLGGTTKRAMSVGQLSAASSQRDLRPTSNQSSGVYEEQNSDTRSTHSATTGGASSSTTGGGHTSAVMQSTMASPGWLLRKHDFWIALKGIVFRIRTDLTVDDLPAVPRGRGLYYRLVLLPVFSGRDCTRAFAWAQLSCSPMDFLSVEDYVNTWRSKLLAAAGNAPQGRAPIQDSGSMIDAKFAAPPREWPIGLREHINRIFSTFLLDFEVLGELEDGREDLWF